MLHGGRVPCCVGSVFSLWVVKAIQGPVWPSMFSCSGGNLNHSPASAVNLNFGIAVVKPRNSRLYPECYEKPIRAPRLRKWGVGRPRHKGRFAPASQAFLCASCGEIHISTPPAHGAKMKFWRQVKIFTSKQ